MTAVFFGHNMIDGMGGQSKRFGDQTVFAAFGGPLAHQAAEFCRNAGRAHGTLFPASFKVAWALAMRHEVLDMLPSAATRPARLRTGRRFGSWPEGLDALLEGGRKAAVPTPRSATATAPQDFQNVSKPREASGASIHFAADQVAEFAANDR